MIELKRTHKTLLTFLAEQSAETPDTYTLQAHFPIKTTLTVENALRDLKKAGLIEYGRNPKQSLSGYRITEEGIAALDLKNLPMGP